MSDNREEVQAVVNAWVEAGVSGNPEAPEMQVLALLALDAVVPEHDKRVWDQAHDTFCPHHGACSMHGKPGDRALIYSSVCEGACYLKGNFDKLCQHNPNGTEMVWAEEP